MGSQLRTIRLYGSLGARFGRMYRLAVSSPCEAIRALCVVVPGFERGLAESGVRGVRYAVFVGKRNLAPAELAMPGSDEDIRIAPILSGAKSGGLFQVLAGAALIAAAVYAPWSAAGIAALGTSGAVVAPTVLGLGISLALGGVTQMLTPQQKGLSTKDSPDNGASYNFNGPVNTVAQGNPVPVLYGELFVGSVVISAGIYSEDAV